MIAWGCVQTDLDSCIVPPAATSGVTAIAAGRFESLALKSDGSVVAWGCRGPVPWDVCDVPVEAESGVVAIAAGSFHDLALKRDGSVVAWGCGQVGFDGGQCAVPAVASSRVTAIAAGDFDSLAIVGVRCRVPRLVDLTIAVAKASLARAHCVAGRIRYADSGRRGRGRVISAGHGVGSMLPPGTTVDLVVGGTAPPLSPAPDAAAAGSVVAFPCQKCVPKAALAGVSEIAVSEIAPGGIALKQDGSVIAWGCTGGNDEIWPRCIVPEAASSDVTAIASGTNFMLALKKSGSVVAWGCGSYVYTPPPDSACSLPAAVESGVTAIAAGYNYGLALKQDGSVIAWGCTFDAVNRNPPEAASRDVTAIAAGGENLALKRDGSVVGWGYPSTVPAAAMSGVAAIAASETVDLALKLDGSVVAWSPLCANYPELGVCNVPATKDVIGIAAGAYHALALTQDGRVVAWGCGQVAGFTVGTVQCAVPPAATSGVTAIAAGGQQSVALVAFHCEVPNVLAQTLAAATAALDQAHRRTGKVQFAHSRREPRAGSSRRASKPVRCC